MEELKIHARRPVEWHMAVHLGDQLTRHELKMALKHRRPAPTLLNHSDQGQYASLDYRTLLQKNKVAISMLHKGNTCDNAPMESFLLR